MSYAECLTRNFEASIAAKREFLLQVEQHEVFQRAVGVMADCYRNGGRIYVAGNGGSAADAQHLAAEFVSRLARERAPLPAEALTVDTSILTAIGNDYGFDQIFARQIEGKATDRDMFLGITTSGQSPNILRALEQCHVMGVPSVIFSGRDGGTAKQMADYCIVVPGACTSVIQELHIVLSHTLCECIETAIFEF